MKSYVIAMSYEEECYEGPEVYLVKADNETEALIFTFKKHKSFTAEEIDYLLTGGNSEDEIEGEDEGDYVQVEVDSDSEDDDSFEIDYDFLQKISWTVKCLDEETFDEVPEGY